MEFVLKQNYYFFFLSVMELEVYYIIFLILQRWVGVEETRSINHFNYLPILILSQISAASPTTAILICIRLKVGSLLE